MLGGGGLTYGRPKLFARRGTGFLSTQRLHELQPLKLGVELFHGNVGSSKELATLT